MKYVFYLLAFIALAVPTHPASAQSRLKDIVDVEGVRTNQLVGYGLVAGLNGTGDTLRNSPFTEQSLGVMLERMGVSINDENMRTENIAAVIVTATLPPFPRQGSRLDVNVSSLGDATSLQGGELIVTPLMGADGEIYAIAQGAVTTGGFTAEGKGQEVTRNTPTVGRIPNGALIEREIDFSIAEMETINLNLRSPDFTTAMRVEEAINGFLGGPNARMLDPTTVSVRIPATYRGDTARFIATLEPITVVPDTPAKVVINERNGTIVIGENVRIGEVAISQSGMTITITENPTVSQPLPFSDGDTEVLPDTQIDVEEQEADFAVLDGPVTLNELVTGLNAMGVRPREIISILQAIKAAGALHAELEII